MDSNPNRMTYKNTAKNAPYAPTCKDHDEYIRTARRPSPWCAVEGFQFETISFDMMHLVYLGIAKNHVPSCLKLLKLFGFHYEPGESDAKFLKRVSMEMKQDCKERKCLSFIPVGLSILIQVYFILVVLFNLDPIIFISIVSLES